MGCRRRKLAAETRQIGGQRVAEARIPGESATSGLEESGGERGIRTPRADTLIAPGMTAPSVHRCERFFLYYSSSQSDSFRVKSIEEALEDEFTIPPVRQAIVEAIASRNTRPANHSSPFAAQDIQGGDWPQHFLNCHRTDVIQELYDTWRLGQKRGTGAVFRT